MRAVGIQTRRIDDSDASEQMQIRNARLGDRSRVHGDDPVALACCAHLHGCGWSNRLVARRGSSHPQEDGGSPVAQAKTRAAVPGRLALGTRNAGGTESVLDVGAEPLRPLHQADQIVTHVCHHRRLGRDREQGIKACHPIGFRWRDGQTLTEIAECLGADPAASILHSM